MRRMHGGKDPLAWKKEGYWTSAAVPQDFNRWTGKVDKRREAESHKPKVLT